MRELTKREMLERNKKALEYYHKNRSKVMCRPYYAINTPEKNTKEYYLNKMNPQTKKIPKPHPPKPLPQSLRQQCTNRKIHICSTFGCPFRSSKLDNKNI